MHKIRNITYTIIKSYTIAQKQGGNKMGNRAVITTTETGTVQEGKVGLYLHWNGGYDSVNAFLTYADMKGHRSPEQDCYGWARLAQIIGNFFGGTTSIGIDTCSRLDTNNYDNGTYFIENWKIVGRAYKQYEDSKGEYELLDFLEAINNKQPKEEQFADIQKAYSDYLERK